MSNAIFKKLLFSALMISTATFFLTEKIYSQENASADSLESISTESYYLDSVLNQFVISASYQYQNIPGSIYINYYGGSIKMFPEEKISENLAISLSGSIYYGKGSDDSNYVHVPFGGLVAFIILVTADKGKQVAKYWPVVFAENIYLNIGISENFIISPFISLFGFDAVPKDEPDDSQALFSNGAGVNLNVLLTRRLALSSSFAIKYFSGNMGGWGYTASIDLGYVFSRN